MKKHIQKIQEIDNSWFFSKPHPLLRFLLIYINGDMITLLPLMVCLLICGIVISIKFALILLAIYIVFRHIGEMIYWLLQQFGTRTYRPDDFGFKKLDNNAIYIIYQTWSLAGIIGGTALLLYILNIR